MLGDRAIPLRRAVDACLRRAGFERGLQRAAGGRWTREVDGAVQHVRLTFDPPSALARRSGARTRARIQLGVVHPIVNMAFVRPTPTVPHWPDDVHVTVDLGELDQARQPATWGMDEVLPACELLAGAGIDWFAELRDPRDALSGSTEIDPFVALEIAAVVGDREAGDRAADRARDAAAATERGDLRVAREKRWRAALDRLHQR